MRPSAKPGRWCRNAIGCTEGKSMARKKQSYIKGSFTHRRTESRLHGRVAGRRAVGRLAEVVSATGAAAKAGRRHRTRLAGAIPWASRA